jgi:DNA-binding MarR family transcriptional regulator
VLLLLGQHGPLDQAELGVLASVDRSTLSALLDRLEARRLVTRTIDLANRRRRIVELTRWSPPPRSGRRSRRGGDWRSAGAI